MNGRQFTFGTSGRPLAQFLAMIVMGVVLVTAVIVVILNLVVDLLQGWLNPKVRLS